MTTIPYWHGPPALWPYRIDFTGPVIYVRAAIQITGPACVGLRIGDIYFRRRALNYLDNIPDNPDAITVPCYASVITQFATLAYTEPPDAIVITGTGVAPGTFVVPMNWNNANNSIECIGGGGGGGSGYGSAGGGGGGGGGYSIATNVTLTPGASITLQIGQGGNGAVNTNNTPGQSGTSTIFNTALNTVVAGGGGGGVPAGGTPGSGTHQGGIGGEQSYAGIVDSGGSGGGGAGGPHGSGLHGGVGAFVGGSGGGGAADGGTAGVNSTGSFGGVGGTAWDGTAGGSGGAGGVAGGPGSHGSGGGGGGYIRNVTNGAPGGQGGSGVLWTDGVIFAGPGGGGGGGGPTSNTPPGPVEPAGDGGLYGGGGGGGPGGISAAGQRPGKGASGCIVITMTPVAMSPIVWIFT